MKAKRTVLYASLALNVALLVLLAWPSAPQAQPLFAQVASRVGNYSAVSAQAGGSRDALWVADRVSGTVAVYRYEYGGDDQPPLMLMDRRDLNVDLEEAQVGNLMLISTAISSSRTVVCAIDTDSERMVVYEYDPGEEYVEVLQKNDLRVDMGKVQPAAPQQM